jgi:hypothetical protein
MESTADFFAFYLGCVGAVLIIVRSELFDPVRRGIGQYKTIRFGSILLSPLHKIIQCPRCCGFWVGLLFAFLLTGSSGVSPVCYVTRLFILACGVSFLSVFFDLTMSALYRADAE